MTDDIHSPNGPVAPVADAPRNGGGPRWLHSLRARLGLNTEPKPAAAKPKPRPTPKPAPLSLTPTQ